MVDFCFFRVWVPDIFQAGVDYRGKQQVLDFNDPDVVTAERAKYSTHAVYLALWYVCAC